MWLREEKNALGSRAWSREGRGPSRPLTPGAEDPHSFGIRKWHIQDQLVAVKELIRGIAGQHHWGHVLQVWRQWPCEAALRRPTPSCWTAPSSVTHHPPRLAGCW